MHIPIHDPVTLCYDGSWPGLLTAIFKVYEYKLTSVSIIPEREALQAVLFARQQTVDTDLHHAARVQKGVEGLLGTGGFRELYFAYLSEKPDVANLILRAVQYYIGNRHADHRPQSNYAQQDVLRIKQINKSVSREIHRFKAFVRFKMMHDNLYFARIEPDYNVLPLIVPHFRQRYPDQSWLIYDVKRCYGAYYDQKEVVEITLHNLPDESELSNRADSGEALYDKLWRTYFNSTNITERKNTKLHLQHMPRRYWKYLNEKI